MLEYDDSELIARIESLLSARPELSRRAAIIEVAGKSQLRRLETKMKKSPSRDETTPPRLIGGAAHLIEGDMRLIDGTVQQVSSDLVVIKADGGQLVKATIGGAENWTLPGHRVRAFVSEASTRDHEIVLMKDAETGRMAINDRLASAGTFGRWMNFIGFAATMFFGVLNLANMDLQRPILFVLLVVSMAVLGIGGWRTEAMRRRFVRGLVALYGDALDADADRPSTRKVGVDDTEAMAAVRAAMNSSPGLSRRSAIIAIAGEDALRRIEMKMKRDDESAQLVIERPLGLLKSHKLAHTPLKKESGKVIRTTPNGFWFSGASGKAFLWFRDGGNGADLLEAANVTILRHDDQVVALKSASGIQWDTALISVVRQYLVASLLVLLPIAWVLLIGPFGTKEDGITNIVGYLIGSASILLGGSWVVWLLHTGDGRPHDRPYPEMERLLG